MVLEKRDHDQIMEGIMGVACGRLYGSHRCSFHHEGCAAIAIVDADYKGNDVVKGLDWHGYRIVKHYALEPKPIDSSRILHHVYDRSGSLVVPLKPCDGHCYCSESNECIKTLNCLQVELNLDELHDVDDCWICGACNESIAQDEKRKKKAMMEHAEKEWGYIMMAQKAMEDHDLDINKMKSHKLSYVIRPVSRLYPERTKTWRINDLFTEQWRSLLNNLEKKVDWKKKLVAIKGPEDLLQDVEEAEDV